MLQWGRETWRKKRRETVREKERERERDLWEEERPKSVTVRLWGEKKWENLPWEREDAKKSCFPQLQTKIIFIGDVTREREIVFQNFFLENSL